MPLDRACILLSPNHAMDSWTYSEPDATTSTRRPSCPLSWPSLYVRTCSPHAQRRASSPAPVTTEELPKSGEPTASSSCSISPAHIRPGSPAAGHRCPVLYTVFFVLREGVQWNMMSHVFFFFGECYMMFFDRLLDQKGVRVLNLILTKMSLTFSLVKMIERGGQSNKAI